MKRRHFLKTPAVTLMLPAAGSFAALERLSAEPTMPQASPGAEKFTQRIHQDFITYREGIEYFFLGNGDIHAILQYAPDRSGLLPSTFLGLTLVDAERFSRKWSTYLFHPERGFERTMLVVFAGGKSHTSDPSTLESVQWVVKEGVPVVEIAWKAGGLRVVEELHVPDRGGYLLRRVRITNEGDPVSALSLGLALTPNFAIFDEIGPDPKTRSIQGRGYTEVTLSCLDGDVETVGRYDLRVKVEPPPKGGETVVRFVYTIRMDTAPLKSADTQKLWHETVAYWKPKPMLQTNNDVVDHLYRVARSGLKAQLARSGRRDSGYWMYNMEWVRDDVMMMQGMAMAGFHDEARTILLKILSKAIGPDGCAIESSRWSGYDYTELDQNGQILFAAWVYLCWTGDVELIKEYWQKIVLAGDFPLLEVFKDAKSTLLRNKREFWERDDKFGVEDGYELVYQFWVAYGLEKGAAVARAVGDVKTASRWESAAANLKDVMLNHPKYRFVENGHLIKRRLRDGAWQRYFVPPNRTPMPPGSPIATLDRPECDPDTGTLYPIIYGYVDPRGEVARKTLAYMDTLWNQRWKHGGYARYNTDSEPDPPGPWPIASLLIARAALEARDYERVWKSLRWIAEIHGGRSGGWFERYGPSITPPAPPVSVVGWAWGEVVLLMVQHLLGFKPDLDGILIQPQLLPGLDIVKNRFTIRNAEVDIEVARGAAAEARVNGSTVSMSDGAISIAYPAKGTSTSVRIIVNKE
jgi:hypothetical protein